MHEHTIIVYGQAKPGGSKKAFTHPSTGRAVITDASGKDGKEWRRRVAQSAGEQFTAGLLDGPLRVTMTFFKPRPRSHYGTGRNEGVVKDSAPRHPTTRPDVLKLGRAVEDALTGIVWRDDAQIVDELLVKRFGDPARCIVTVVPA